MDDGRWTTICLCGESYDKSDDARHDCTPEDAVIEMPLERAQYLRDRIEELEAERDRYLAFVTKLASEDYRGNEPQHVQAARALLR